MQTEALVDSGATATFIDKKFAENENLVMSKLANPYVVKNADGTSNTNGQITHYVRGLIEIGDHKSTHYLFVTNLGDNVERIVPRPPVPALQLQLLTRLYIGLSL